MEYKVLEDLINILISKSGHTSLDDIKDYSLLNKRKEKLKKSIEDIKNKIDEDKYEDKESKTKDLNEKEFYTERINKLNDKLKSLKEIDEDEKRLVEEELILCKESLNIINYKIDKSSYRDIYSKERDKRLLKSLENDIECLNKVVDNTIDPVSLGKSILDAFKSGTSYSKVEDDIEKLSLCAKDKFTSTKEEISSSNIFLLMEEYKNKINKDSLDINFINVDLKDNEKYINERIEELTYNLKLIEKRNAEIVKQIDKLMSLYICSDKNRNSKEEYLKNLIIKVYEVDGKKLDEMTSIIDDIRKGINLDKEMLNIYSNDILTLKRELYNLNISSSNMKYELENLNKSSLLIKDRIKDETEDKINKLNNIINSSYNNMKYNSLVNEQKYLYVDVDVIKSEIINLWKNKKNNEISKIEEIDFL